MEYKYGTTWLAVNELLIRVAPPALHSCQTKISDLNRALVGQEDVVRLEVPVNDVARVKIVHALCCLASYLHQLDQLEPHFLHVEP